MSFPREPCEADSRCTPCASRSGLQLEKIPAIAVKVFKDGNGSVTLLPRLFTETNSPLLHRLKVLPEIVSMQKQKNPASGLASNPLRLPCGCSFCQQKARLGWAARRHQNPTIA